MRPNPKAIAAVTLICVLLWLPVASWIFMVGVDWHANAGLVRHFGWPNWQWLTYLPQSATNRTVDLWIKVGAAVASLPPLLCAIAWIRFLLKGKVRPLFGEAHWATSREMRKAGIRITRRPPTDGFLLGRTESTGRYVSLPPERHISVRAPTRSGKGVAIGIPNAMLHDGSLLAFSVKTDIWRAVAAERLRQGNRVFIFRPGSPDLRTHRWNPLGKVPRHGPGIYDACQSKLSRIIPETRASNPFFDNAARRWATALAVLIAETPGMNLSVGTLKRTLTRHDAAPYIHDMIVRARAEGRPYNAVAVDTTLGWLSRIRDKEVQSVLETFNSHLGLWDNEVIAAATEASDFDLGTLRSRPTSIFLVVGVPDMARLRPLLRLFLAEFVAENTRYDWGEDPKHKHEVRGKAIFDEFWAMGNTPEATDAVSFIASAGWDLGFITQTKAQIEHIQGKAGAENIFANTTEVFFAGADMRTAKEIEELGGKDTVEEVSKSRPAWMGWAKPDKHTENRQKRARELVLASEVRTMDQDRIIVSARNMPIMRLRKVKYYEDPNLSWREAPPPPVPRLSVTVERDEGSPDMVIDGKAEEEEDATPPPSGRPMAYSISYRV